MDQVFFNKSLLPGVWDSTLDSRRAGPSRQKDECRLLWLIGPLPFNSPISSQQGLIKAEGEGEEGREGEGEGFVNTTNFLAMWSCFLMWFRFQSQGGQGLISMPPQPIPSQIKKTYPLTPGVKSQDFIRFDAPSPPQIQARPWMPE